MKIANLIKKLTVGAALSFASFQGYCTWYVANGSAAIIDGVTQARNDAVNDAIRNALLQAGASVQIEQKYKNGVLESDSVRMNSASPIRKVLVVEEQRSMNKVNVTVKIFIDDKRINRCSQGKVKKTLLPVSFRYADSQAYQSSIGIESMNKEMDKLLSEKLSNAAVFNVKPTLNINIATKKTLNSAPSQNESNMVSLATRYSSQYVMTATINTFSQSEPNDNVLTKLLFTPTRSINFDIDVYDAINNANVFHQNYTAEAEWPFKNSEFLDLRSDRFKGSAFGQRMYDLIDRAVGDLVATFQCASVSARVIDNDGDDFIINLGRDSGILKDMEFTLEQTSTMQSGLGGEYEIYEGKSGKYKVIAVYPRTAKLRPVDLQNNILNVNINDVVTLH